MDNITKYINKVVMTSKKRTFATVVPVRAGQKKNHGRGIFEAKKQTSRGGKHMAKKFNSLFYITNQYQP